MPYPHEVPGGAAVWEPPGTTTSRFIHLLTLLTGTRNPAFVAGERGRRAARKGVAR